MAQRKPTNPAQELESPQKGSQRKGQPPQPSSVSPVTASEKSEKLLQRQANADRALLAALNKRAALAQKIAESTDFTPGDVAGTRDAKVIEALIERNQGPLTSQMVRSVFRELLSGCRRLCRQTRAGYLGPEFSYSYQAAVERFGQSVDLVPLGTIRAVFEEVSTGNVDYGLVPLENSTDGRIADTLNMLTRVPVRIAGEVHLRIHHNLLGTAPRSKVRQICSKPQAISQCRVWLSEHFPTAEIVETSSTTAAAEMAAKNPNQAAIASVQAAVNYGLDVLAANIEDNPDNVTRFAVLGQNSGERTGNDKTALLFQVSHQPGALADTMSIFKRNRLNLTWIESFPLQGTKNEYFFFAELQGHEKELRVRRAVTALGKKTQLLEVLGSYAATQPID